MPKRTRFLEKDYGCAFCLQKGEIMTVEKPNTASAEAEPKPEKPLEQPQPEQAATPASETPVEEWDKERAAATIKAQRAEEKRLKEQLKDYERLKAEEQKRIEAQMSETERLNKQLEETRKQNEQLQTSMLRQNVILKTGLPLELADRLKGATEEELLADAEALKKLIPPKKPNQVTTNPGEASIAETDAQKRERLFGKQSDVFDIKTIEAGGGGVVWNTDK